MLDLLMIGVTLAFFVGCLAFMVACTMLWRRD